MKLNDAKVLVTGGGSGIGLATARALKARGAQVAISGRRADVLGRAAKEIGAIPVTADVTDEASVARLIESVVRELGGYNVLINNAGIGSSAPLLSVTPDATDKEVFELFDKYNLRSLTVINDLKCPVGAITVDDIVSRLRA